MKIKIYSPALFYAILAFGICNPSTFASGEEIFQQQNYTGIYSIVSGDVTITLTLRQDQNQNVTGTLKSSNGSNYSIEGVVSEGIASGVCKGNDGGLYFEAFLDGNDLTISLIEPDQNNMPDYDTSEYLVMSRSSQQPASNPESASPIEQLTASAPVVSQNKTKESAAPQANQSTGKVANVSDDIVVDELSGYKFYIPEGWVHQKGEGYILLGSNTIPGLITVFAHQADNLQNMIGEMHQEIQDEGISLSLLGEVEKKAGNMASGFYTGIVQGEQAKGYGIGVLSPHGGGVFILAVSTPEKLGEEIMAAANAISQNTTFSKPTAGAQDLVKHFAGEWTWTNGYRTEWMTFFPNGSYSDQSEASYSGDLSGGGNWGAASQNSNLGRWNIQGTKDAGVITVIGTDGSQTRYEYSVFVERGEKFYWEYMFNGYHYRKQKAFE